jgi:hypothetical protein
MLTLRSTSGGYNSYAMEVFDENGRRNLAVDEAGDVFMSAVAGFTLVGTSAVPAFGAATTALISLSGGTYGQMNLGNGSNSVYLKWDSTNRMAVQSNCDLMWSTSSRLDAGGGVILTERTAPGTPAGNTIHLYAKDLAGVSRLYYTDDAGVVHGPL